MGRGGQGMGPGGWGQPGSEMLLCSPGSLTLGHISGHLSGPLFTYLEMGTIIIRVAGGLLRELNRKLQRFVLSLLHRSQ